MYSPRRSGYQAPSIGKRVNGRSQRFPASASLRGRSAQIYEKGASETSPECAIRRNDRAGETEGERLSCGARGVADRPAPLTVPLTNPRIS